MPRRGKAIRSERTRAVLYARVSDPEQAEKDLSLPAQLEAMREYARSHGLSVVREYVEPGVTARDDNRVEFRGMMQCVLADESDVGTILVLHTSRFMRNVAKARLWKGHLEKRGVRVVAIRQEVTDDASGHLMENVFEAFDQYESEIIGERVSLGMRQNAKQGYFNGSTPPFGHGLQKVVGPGGRPKNRLAVAADEAEIVREVFRRYVGGSGAKSVARELNQRGLRHRNRPWNRDLVLKVIGERAVAGTYYWGRRDSRSGRVRPGKEWVPIPVEPIIDQELFDLAQRVRAGRDPVRNPGRASSSPLLLAGLLRCASCGAKYQLQTATGSKGKEYRYYQCRNAARAGREVCSGHRISVETLDRAILNHAAEELFTEQRCREILRQFVEEQGVLRQKTEQQRRLLERERDGLERRLARWYEQIEVEPELGDLGLDRVRELKARRDEVADALAKIAPLRSLPPYVYRSETIGRFRTSIQDAFMSSDRSLARTYLNGLIERITISPEEITIDAKIEGMVAILASGGGGGADGLTHDVGVRTHVVDWHARQDSNLRPVD